MSYPLLKFAGLALGMGLMSAASAISLGDLEVRSGLGQPFSASVHYVTPHADDVHALCIHASTDVSTTSGTSVPLTSGVPFLPDPRFEVAPGQGGGTISIRTARVVNEPLMRLNLVINCGASAVLSREFAVMLDPPQAELAAPRPALQLSPAIVAPSAPSTAASGTAVPRGTTPASGAPAGAAPSAASASAAASSQSPVLRRAPRAAAPPAAPAAAAASPRATTPLPYEPGVTPPPGRGPAARPRPPPEAVAGPKYRLSLSRPGADLPANPMLRSSDTLTMPESTITAAQREALREEWHWRQSEDSLAQARRMNDQLAKLDRGLAEVVKQVTALKDQRDQAQLRVRQLEEEKQSLTAWLNGLALALGFIGCVALAALAFWTYRRRSEQRAGAGHASLFDAAPAVPAKAQRIEPELEPEHESEEQYDVERYQAAEPAAAPAPVPRAPPMRPTPPRQFTADPPTRTYTETVEVERKPAPPLAPIPFSAEPPVIAPAVPPVVAPVITPSRPPAPQHVPPVVRQDAVPEAAPEETQAFELPVIAFDLPPPDEELEHPSIKADDIDFSIEFGAPQASPAAQPEAAAEDPFAYDAAPPPPPSVAATYVESRAVGEPTPTQRGMKIMIDELAAAQLGAAATTPPATGAAPPASGSHRTLDIELGEDDDSEMRAQLYRQEFELKLFPEIVHGQAKLKVPHSVISLARTYYQEDFDTNRAINLLEYAADRTPDPQRVRLALLEILRMEGMSREYIAVARTFHRQFTDAEEWNTVAAYGKLLAPEEPLFAEADTTGYDLNMPSMWLGSTLDMTRYVLAQDLHDAMHGPLAGAEAA